LTPRLSLEDAAAALDDWCDYLQRVLGAVTPSSGPVPVIPIPVYDLQNLLRELEDVNRTVHDLL
jgi:hypothetical protein